MHSLASLKTRLSALHGASFLGIGVSTAFFPLWLESRGLEASTIGVILAIPVLTRVVVTAPLTSLADAALGARRLLVLSYAGSGLAYLALLWSASAPAIALLVCLVAVAQAPIVPTNDLVTTSAVRRDPRLDYGRIRLWGSIAFMSASIGAGFLLKHLSIEAVVGLLAALPLTGLLATIIAVPQTFLRGPGGEPEHPPRRSARFPASLWLVMGAAACAQASHAAIYGFGSLHWRRLGFSDPMIGAFWAIGVVAEIVVFLRLGWVVGRPRDGLKLVMLGSAGALVRFGALAFNPGLVATLALQTLHGLSFAATHLGTMSALSALAPDTARGRAQGTLGAMSALVMAGATIASGIVFREAGPLVFAAMTPLGAGGLILGALALRAYPSQPHKAGEGG